MNHKSLNCLPFVLLTLLFTPVLLPAVTSPVWTSQLPDSAKWHSVSAVGTLLVGTDKALCSIDPDDGRVIWTRDDLAKTASFNVREIPGTPVLLINDYSGTINPKTKIYALNIATGETLWETERTQGYSVGAYPIYSKNTALVFANTWAQEGGSGLYMTAYDLATGKQLWQTKHSKANEVPLHPADNSGRFFVKLDLSGHQEPVVEGDLLYVPFAGVHCYDLNTGALKWGVPFRAVPKEFKHASAPLVFDANTVYASGVNEVYALDKANGAVKWKSKKVFSGTIVELADAGDRLIVRLGGNFFEWGSRQWKLEKPLEILALDKQTGNELWRYTDVKDGITNLQILKDQNTVMLADSRSLIGLDLNSNGKAMETFKIPIEFKRKLGGGEAALKIGLGVLGGLRGITSAAVHAGQGKDRLDIPVAITRQATGDLVVRGKQHLLAFDPAQKQIRWSTYYAAPGPSGFETAAMTALTAFSALSYNASYASGGSSLSSASSGIERSLESYNKFYNKRYSATKTAKQNAYILTRVEEGNEKGIGLVAIDLSTGEPGAKVLLKDKEPDYAVDDVTGRLYYVKSKKEIEAFSLE